MKTITTILLSSAFVLGGGFMSGSIQEGTSANNIVVQKKVTETIPACIPDSAGSEPIKCPPGTHPGTITVEKTIVECGLAIRISNFFGGGGTGYCRF